MGIALYGTVWYLLQFKVLYDRVLTVWYPMGIVLYDTIGYLLQYKVLYGRLWYCMVQYDIVRSSFNIIYCLVIHVILWYPMVLFVTVWSCVEIYCTASW